MATKEELEGMAKDLYKRLGGTRTKDGRIVRALLANWKAAELNAAQQLLAPDGAYCDCLEGTPFVPVTVEVCAVCKRPAGKA